MKRTLLGLGAMVFSRLLMAAAKAPERAVKGNRNGWMPPDSQNHNAAAAERGWARKRELFKKALA